MMRLYIKILVCSAIAVFSSFSLKDKHLSAQVTAPPGLYNNFITFKIDSASVVGNNLEYSIMFWRTNKDWNIGANTAQDTALGDVDFYFNLKEGIFDEDVTPVILRAHDHIDLGSGVSENFLKIGCLYHAERFFVRLNVKANSGFDKNMVNVLLDIPTELCKVSLPMIDSRVNPGFVWDELATGGQSNYADPLRPAFEGNIKQNPDTTLQLRGYFEKGYFCQGGTIKLWARGFSTGTKQKMTWTMSNSSDVTIPITFESNTLGNTVGEGQVHHSGIVSTPYGDLPYMISASNQSSDVRVDTLIIPNAQGWMDSMYFQCILSDESLSVAPITSVDGETQVFLRDSIFAYFATSDPDKLADATTTAIGASDRTDTIYKCPKSGGLASVYFFGPKNDEKALETIGIEASSGVESSPLVITYEGLDAFSNTIGPFTETLTNWTKVAGKEINGRALYNGLITLPLDFTDASLAWITAVSTINCDNGASYALYDTVSVTDVKDNLITTRLPEISLSGGESVDLLTRPGVTFTYSLKDPEAPCNGRVEGAKYYAPNAICEGLEYKTDTIVYEYKFEACDMELLQIVNFADYHYLKLKVYLEGPYVTNAYKNDGLMVTTYHDNKELPTYTPYIEIGEPGYGDYVISQLPNTGSNRKDSIVDWLEVAVCVDEDYLAGSTMKRRLKRIDSVSCFLLSDGRVCDIAGNIDIRFKQLAATTLGGERNYYITVDHRNHVRIRSRDLYTLSSSLGAEILDLTNSVEVFEDNVSMLNVTTRICGMYAGSVISGSRVITGSDASEIAMKLNGSGYLVENILFARIITGAAMNLVYINLSKQIKE